MTSSKQKGRSGLAWTDEEIETLKSHYPEKGPKKLVASDLLTGRSYEAIRKKAQSLDLKAKPSRGAQRATRWTEKEDDVLRTHYASLGPKEIHNRGFLEGRTYQAILSRAKKLDLTSVRNIRWDEDEEAYLIQLFEQHPEKSGKQLYHLACQKDGGMFEDKSYSAVMSKARSLGLSRQWRWEPEDEQILRDYYPKLGALELEASGMLSEHKSAEAIRSKAFQLGIGYLGNSAFSAKAKQNEASKKAQSDNWGKMDKLKDALKGF